MSEKQNNNDNQNIDLLKKTTVWKTEDYMTRYGTSESILHSGTVTLLTPHISLYTNLGTDQRCGVDEMEWVNFKDTGH